MSALTVIEYTAKAMECRHNASKTAVAGIQAIWLQMADKWDDMAERRENNSLISMSVLGMSKHSNRNQNAPIGPSIA